MYAGDEYYDDEITSPLYRPMPNTQHIASYLSQSGDIEVTVTLNPNMMRYVVRIHDLDAEETLPAFKFFTDVEIAKTYALKCAASGETEDLPL